MSLVEAIDKDGNTIADAYGLICEIGFYIVGIENN